MVFKNVRIVNYDQIIPCADLIVKGSLINKIIPNNNQFEAIIVPGLIDLHIHGLMGFDVMDSKKAVEKISLFLGQKGITSFLPTLMTASTDKVEKAITNNLTANIQGAKLLGLHLEGPFISPIKRGAHNPKYLLNPSKMLIRKWQQIAEGKIKKVTYAPELKNGINFTKTLIDLKINPSPGHTNGNYQNGVEVIKAGARTTSHLWNRMSGVKNRAPGFAQAMLSDSKVIPELIGDLFTVDLETLKFTIQIKTPQKIIMVSDSIRPTGLDDGDYQSGTLLVTKKKNKIFLKNTKTIAGSCITLWDIFQSLLKLKYSLKDVVAMTSYNAAQFLNNPKIGYLKVNTYGDFLVLDRNYKLKSVFINGKEQVNGNYSR